MKSIIVLLVMTTATVAQPGVQGPPLVPPSIYPSCDQPSDDRPICWKRNEDYFNVPDWAVFDDYVGGWTYMQICVGRYCVPYDGRDSHVPEVLSHDRH